MKINTAGVSGKFALCRKKEVIMSLSVALDKIFAIIRIEEREIWHILKL